MTQRTALSLIFFLFACCLSAWLWLHNYRPNAGTQENSGLVTATQNNGEKIRATPDSTLVREEIIKPSLSGEELQVEVPWWEDSNQIKGMANRFEDLFSEYYMGTVNDIEKGEYGDQNLRVTKKSWGRFHQNMMPSLEMFEGSSQVEKYVLSGLLQEVSHNTVEHGGVASVNMSADEAFKLKLNLRNQSLYYAPEVLLNEEFGADWAENQELSKEVRSLWIDMMHRASSIEAELNVRQRCAMHLFGDIEKGQVNLISPGIREYEIGMELLHQEFYDNVLEIIHDSR